MTFIWRKHLMVCLFLGLLAIPIYFVDQTSIGGGGGNWITLALGTRHSTLATGSSPP
jgi:hypothetical protein